MSALRDCPLSGGTNGNMKFSNVPIPELQLDIPFYSRQDAPLISLSLKVIITFLNKRCIPIRDGRNNKCKSDKC